MQSIIGSLAWWRIVFAVLLVFTVLVYADDKSASAELSNKGKVTIPVKLNKAYNLARSMDFRLPKITPEGLSPYISDSDSESYTALDSLIREIPCLWNIDGTPYISSTLRYNNDPDQLKASLTGKDFSVWHQTFAEDMWILGVDFPLKALKDVARHANVNGYLYLAMGNPDFEIGASVSLNDSDCPKDNVGNLKSEKKSPKKQK